MFEKEGAVLGLQHSGSNTMNLAIVLIETTSQRSVLVAANAATASTQEGMRTLLEELSEEHLPPHINEQSY